MSTAKIVVHTDVFVDHLGGRHHPSVLRLALRKFFCYTTVFQAIELFAMARTEREHRAVEDSMAAMKLMGLNPKNARKYGELFASKRKKDRYALLIGGLCIDSRLPLLTNESATFKGIPGLTLIPTVLVGKYATGSEILGAAGALISAPR
jgi:predicted nucleic acid-binding protein